jgi:hypothetical protein
MNTNVDTRGLEQVDPPAMRPRIAPPLDAPQRPPFFISNFPIAPPNNSYTARNFTNTNIPSTLIIPATPLNMAGAGINATATIAVVPKLPTPVPAPTIAKALTTVAAGYTFSYNEVRLPLSSNLTINSYKIYRNSANSSASASVIQSNPHNINGISTPVVVVDNLPNGQTAFYWVSAVSTSGQESNLTPAQSGTVTNAAGFNSNSQLASSFNGIPLNTTWVPTNTTSLSNDGIHTFITITSNTNQFGPGQVSYNSGTTDPLNTGPYYIFCKDPQFQGGAVIYHLAGGSVAPLTAIAAGDGVLLLGAINTSSGTATTGGGATGGTSATTGGLGNGAAGGRGIGSVIVQV